MPICALSTVLDREKNAISTKMQSILKILKLMMKVCLVGRACRVINSNIYPKEAIGK